MKTSVFRIYFLAAVIVLLVTTGLIAGPGDEAPADETAAAPATLGSHRSG